MDNKFDNVRSTLNNIHESLKLIWQLIMGFALSCAVNEYFNVLHAIPGNLDHTNTHLFFFLYLLTFIRFFFGINRYLDQRYIEFLYKIENKNDSEKDNYIKGRTQKLSGKRRFFDIIMLLLTGVIFVMLGNSLKKGNDLFIPYYIILMVANVVFLSISVIWNFYINYTLNDDHDQINVSMSKYEKFPVFWIMNNLICLFIYWFASTKFPTYTFIAFSIIFYLNTTIDLFKTWKMYFPDIELPNSTNIELPNSTNQD